MPRRQPSNTVLLSGWLFADLLLGGMIIFLASSPGVEPRPTPTPTPSPSTTPRPAVADHLVFWQQPPEGATVGRPLVREPVIAVISDQGRLLASDNNTEIRLSAGDSGDSALVCANATQRVVDGLARFAGCTLNRAGVIKLMAEGSGFRAVTSEPVDVSAAPTQTPEGPCSIVQQPFPVDVAAGPGGAIPTDAQLRQALEPFQHRRAGIVITTAQGATIGEGLLLAEQVNARLDALYPSVFQHAVKRPIRSDIVRGRGYTNLEMFFFAESCR